MSLLTSNPQNYLQFGIPQATEVDYTYVSGGAANDDLIATATYKNEKGTVLGVLSFAYVGATNNIASITRTDV